MFYDATTKIKFWSFLGSHGFKNCQNLRIRAIPCDSANLRGHPTVGLKRTIFSTEKNGQLLDTRRSSLDFGQKLHDFKD